MEVPREELARVKGEAVVDEVVGEPEVVPEQYTVSTVQYSAVQYSTVQYSTVQYST